MHPIEVRDVIPPIAQRRRVDRVQPQAGDPQMRQVVQPADQPAQVTAPVAVRIAEQVHLHAIDDRLPVPTIRHVLTLLALGKTRFRCGYCANWSGRARRTGPTPPWHVQGCSLNHPGSADRVVSARLRRPATSARLRPTLGGYSRGACRWMSTTTVKAAGTPMSAGTLILPPIVNRQASDSHPTDPERGRHDLCH